jgi:hypothetical protein
MRNAPKRSIRTRIRPRLEWLESIVDQLPVSTATAADKSSSVSG